MMTMVRRGIDTRGYERLFWLASLTCTSCGDNTARQPPPAEQPVLTTPAPSQGDPGTITPPGVPPTPVDSGGANSGTSSATPPAPSTTVVPGSPAPTDDTGASGAPNEPSSEPGEGTSAETLPSASSSEPMGSAAPDTPSTDVSPPSFLLGADVSSIPEAVDAGATFIDTDGQTKPLLTLLANHGFNAVRLRTFVNPDAPFGYARGTGGSCVKAEPYNDAAHTAEFGAAAKASGMQLLVDFHYSDTWADPGKQIIPEAWRDATSIDDLANRVSQYTTEVLEALVKAGAKPDMVQVGNETTPGMLIHVPGNETDCWGNNSNVNPGVNGQASNANWDNLAKLFKAGADAVHAIDPNIKVVLHVENTDDLDGVRWWVNSALARDIDFEVLGLSAYTAFQGQPAVWQNTLQSLAEEFPDLEFIIAEYNPERTRANQIVHGLPGGRGLGTFFWEPTLSGSWGESMFTQSGNTYTARAQDFAEYDALRLELGL